jgi:hypothetical protein
MTARSLQPFLKSASHLLAFTRHFYAARGQIQRKSTLLSKNPALEPGNFPKKHFPNKKLNGFGAISGELRKAENH